MRRASAGLLVFLAIGMASPRPASGWNFAYARVGKAFAEAKKIVKEALKNLVAKVFGPKAKTLLDALGKLTGKVRDLAANLTQSVSKALEQIKQEAVGGLRELGKSVGDKLTDGFVGKVLALKDAGEREVRQWVESVQKLRTDALGTLRRGLTAAVDPSKRQGLTALEKAIGDLIAA